MPIFHNTEDTFCKDAFWDNNLTWFAAVPDFTECFQNIVFVLIPCCGFSAIAVINFFVSRKSSVDYSLPWTLLNILKIVLCVILLCLSIIELSFIFYLRYMEMNIHDVNIYSSCAKLLIFVLVIFTLVRNKAHAVTSSMLLTIFWLVFSICSIFMYRSAILQAFEMEYSSLEYYKYVMNMLFFPLVFCQFFLSLFSDTTAVKSAQEKDPFDSPLFMFFTFSWFSRYVYKGRKKILTIDDFAPLPGMLKASYVSRLLLKKWDSISAVKEACARHEATDALYGKLAMTLIKAFWPYFIIGCFFQLMDVFTMFIPPLLLDQIIVFISSSNYLWKGYVLCMALFLSDFLMRQMDNLRMFYSYCFALQIKSSLMESVYKKSLRLSSSARKKYTSGEMVNLMSVDIDKIYNFASYSTLVIGSPIKIVLTILMLWLYLGPSCFAGVLVLFLMIVLSGFVTRKTNALQEKQMETKDSRLMFITEVLNGIKVLKLYAWEIPFMKKISSIRSAEVQLIRAFQLCYAASAFIWNCAPFLIAVSCFITYTLLDAKNVLNPRIAFVSMNLLNTMRYDVMEIPELTAEFIQTIVSLKRLSCFLTSEESCEYSVGNMPDSGEAVSIRNATFSWGPKEEPTLKDISFHVPKGSFVAVIGPVGSGKSSLLSAILGEMCKVSGSVDVKGSFAYVPQQAWILNRTLKQNILFVKPFRRKTYNAILDSCCLRPDLEILPGGDNTEIGEKGVTLSGGQKQRVSLARAIYHDANIYLLDDPLSAVDAHVGKHIYEHVFSKDGLLKSKTRILATHNISVLQEADCIFTMRNGRIEETGTYKELMEHGGLFAELIQEYSNIKNSNGLSKTELEDSEGPLSPLPLLERSLSTQVSRRRNTSVDSTSSRIAAQLVEEERMEIGEVKRKTILKYLKTMSIPFLCAFILGYFASQALEVGSNVWLSEWSSDPLLPDGTQDITLRNMRIAIYCVIGFCQALAAAFGSIALAIGSSRASKLFHSRMLESIMKSPMSFFDKTPFGRIINRFGSDIDDIDIEMAMELDGFIACVFAALGTFIVIGISTPIFLIFIIPIGAVYYFIQKLYLITSRQLKRLCSTTRSPVYSHFTETLQGTSSIHAYKVASQFVSAAEEKTDNNILFKFYWNSCSRWLEVRLTFVGNIIILITAILAIQSRGSVVASVAALAITYSLSVNSILNWLVRNGTEVENISVVVERIEEYSNLPSEAPWTISEHSPPTFWPSSGQIEFNCYSTRYREGLDLALKEIDIKIKDGEKVGIVGRTGAGKSSFTLALFRIIEPSCGSISINNIDISEIGLHQLRSKLTIIPQDPVLFTGQLRTNLDPNDQHSDCDLWSSLDHANLKEFVKSLPESLNYQVSEGGGNLSVGQRQLVCLARALLKKTKILILDEATAAVDVETDSLIQSTIREEFKESTVITIAHRLNTVLDYDRILVMDAGRVIEVGHPSELLKQNDSVFHDMAKNAGLL